MCKQQSDGMCWSNKCKLASKRNRRHCCGDSVMQIAAQDARSGNWTEEAVSFANLGTGMWGEETIKFYLALIKRKSKYLNSENETFASDSTTWKMDYLCHCDVKNEWHFHSGHKLKFILVIKNVSSHIICAVHGCVFISREGEEASCLQCITSCQRRQRLPLAWSDFSSLLQSSNHIFSLKEV